MFTGLIEDVGTIEVVSAGPSGRELRIKTQFGALTEGESIAVNGACMTVYKHGSGWFTVAAVETTLGRTTIGGWKTGRRLNLERALVAGGRFGGHMVAGHVDGVATVVSVEQSGDARLVSLAVPGEVMELSVLHGSITVDGVSLTINALPPDGLLQLSLIGYTLAHTTLADLRAGDLVHVEADLIGKYVQRLVQPYQQDPSLRSG